MWHSWKYLSHSLHSYQEKLAGTVPDIFLLKHISLHTQGAVQALVQDCFPRYFLRQPWATPETNHAKITKTKTCLSIAKSQFNVDIMISWLNQFPINNKTALANQTFH